MKRAPRRRADGSPVGPKVPELSPDEFVIVVWTCDDPECEGRCVPPWYRKLAVPKDRMRKGARLRMPHPS